ncbi:MAG: two-component system response regulator [Rhodoferax ferrireducens]|uniref:Two-component system response regulator n=2 Tax=Pseudomonadota TaxID=1224 RepID=A0A1Y1QZ76_9GAMM|nr:MAG: two-component system response regulator [Rhodoferax ferrireducens]OQX16940.1 MAG: two-component system response regulator [Thiothrix lacustris]
MNDANESFAPLSDDATLRLEKARLLIIDDSPDSLFMMHGLLGDHYRVMLADSGPHGLAMARSATPPDLILLDILMPDMDGYEVCRQLKTNTATRDIPVIFLTAKTAEDDEQQGLDLGAVDYITKPISPGIVLARIRTQLTLKASADFLRDQNAFLAREVNLRTREVSAIEDVTIMAMASLAETRDVDTGNHIRRTQHYVRALARQLATHPRFAAFLDNHTIGLLFKSAPLHDIGKVGIPDRILLKPGKLTPQEFEVMKTHTTLGRDAIEHAEQMLGTEVAFLKIAKEIAYSHQEKWDGSGYPQGLKGDQIPISARLMALADVYDALISRRIYKEPISHDAAAGIISITGGRHFDPDVVEAFLAIQDTFKAIALTYTDSSADLQGKRDYLDIAQGEAPKPAT